LEHRWQALGAEGSEAASLLLRRPSNARLKTYQTSIGFFDLAIAAPSMKAAAEAWGSDTDIFRKGFAKETHDPEIVAATMARPGVLLRRPVGSNSLFSENPELPRIDTVAEKRVKSQTKRQPKAQKVDQSCQRCGIRL